LVFLNASFIKALKYFRSLGLNIVINDKIIKNAWHFTLAIWFTFLRPLSYEESIKKVEDAIDKEKVAGD